MSEQRPSAALGPSSRLCAKGTVPSSRTWSGSMAMLPTYQGTQSDPTVCAVSIGFGLKRRHVAVTFIPVPTFS